MTAVTAASDGRLRVEADPEQVFALSEALAKADIYLGELTREEESLEHVFLSLTGNAERGPGTRVRVESAEQGSVG